MKTKKEPDWSPGDVIEADIEGDILLDDGIWTWNPQRAKEFLNKIRGDESTTISIPTIKGE